MKLSKNQLKRIINEEKHKLMREGEMKRRHMVVGDAVINSLEDFPGMSGEELVTYVISDLSEYGQSDWPLTRDEVFPVLDDLLEAGDIFFDEQEDAWFSDEKDFLAWREGGVWSDQRDHDAGWKR